VVSPELTEILPIFVISEDVMIATYENLVTIEASKSPHGAAIDNHVAEMIYLIVRAHPLVPGPDHVFVHFVWICPGTQFLTGLRVR
jgi:hypothetical protein